MTRRKWFTLVWLLLCLCCGLLSWEQFQRKAIQFNFIIPPRIAGQAHWVMTDIRAILSANSIKDVITEEDAKFLATINNQG